MLTIVRADVDALVATHVTSEDLANLEGDGYRYDLLSGDLIRVSPAGFRHGRLAAEIARRLGNFLADHPTFGVVVGAETGFRLSRDPDTVLGPDAAIGCQLAKLSLASSNSRLISQSRSSRQAIAGSPSVARSTRILWPASKWCGSSSLPHALHGSIRLKVRSVAYTLLAATCFRPNRCCLVFVWR